MIYLDGAATARPEKTTYQKALDTALEFPGNPSSQHLMGKAARERLESARENSARLLGCPPDHLYFTSGGTESNNIILTNLLARPFTGDIITTPLEHASAREPLKELSRRGWKIIEVQPEPDGRISPERLARKLTDQTRLVSIHLVHSVTGAIQPLLPLVQRVREKEKSLGRPIHFHCDAVQALGKVPLLLEKADQENLSPAETASVPLGVDSASFSGHKIGAPRGVGLLFNRQPLSVIYQGGGQERGIRGGTENLPGICGLETALEAVTGGIPGALEPGRLKKAETLMDQLMMGLNRLPLFTPLPRERLKNPENYSPWILSASFPPIPGEVLLRVLQDNHQICLSRGSACSANIRRKEQSLGMLLKQGGPEARGAFRISLDGQSCSEDIEGLLTALKKELPLLNRIKG